MARLSPVSWMELVRQLRDLGFEGPYQSGKHPYMLKGDLTLTIPNPHTQEIGVELLVRILAQGGIDRQTWLDN